jgi:hypothetical protein
MHIYCKVSNVHYFNFSIAILYSGTHPYFDHIKINSRYTVISRNPLIANKGGYLHIQTSLLFSLEKSAHSFCWFQMWGWRTHYNYGMQIRVQWHPWEVLYRIFIIIRMLPIFYTIFWQCFRLLSQPSPNREENPLHYHVGSTDILHSVSCLLCTSYSVNIISPAIPVTIYIVFTDLLYSRRWKVQFH